MKYSIRNSHLDLCQYLLEEGHPRDDSLFIDAVISGEPLVLYWCKEESIPVHPHGIVYASMLGKIPIVRILINEFDAEITELELNAAIHEGQRDLVMWFFNDNDDDDDEGPLAHNIELAKVCADISGTILDFVLLDFIHSKFELSYYILPILAACDKASTFGEKRSISDLILKYEISVDLDILQTILDS